jgi:hypothetical protein
MNEKEKNEKERKRKKEKVLCIRKIEEDQLHQSLTFEDSLIV